MDIRDVYFKNSLFGSSVDLDMGNSLSLGIGGKTLPLYVDSFSSLHHACGKFLGGKLSMGMRIYGDSILNDYGTNVGTDGATILNRINSLPIGGLTSSSNSGLRLTFTGVFWDIDFNDFKISWNTKPIYSLGVYPMGNYGRINILNNDGHQEQNAQNLERLDRKERQSATFDTTNSNQDLDGGVPSWFGRPEWHGIECDYLEINKETLNNGLQIRVDWFATEFFNIYGIATHFGNNWDIPFGTIGINFNIPFLNINVENTPDQSVMRSLAAQTDAGGAISAPAGASAKTGSNTNYLVHIQIPFLKSVEIKYAYLERLGQNAADGVAVSYQLPDNLGKFRFELISDKSMDNSRLDQPEAIQEGTGNHTRFTYFGNTDSGLFSGLNNVVLDYDNYIKNKAENRSKARLFVCF